MSLAPLSTAGVVPGRTIAVGLISGRVFASVPRARTPIAIGARTVLPVGSRLDTRHGILKITALRPGAGAAAAGAARTSAAPVAQTIVLTGARFSVAQRVRGGGFLMITMTGGDFSVCPSRRRAHAAVKRRPRATGPTVVRQLWSRDGGGNFSTHGRDSVGTVQGTWWLTADRCDGTLTRVVGGQVLVRALHVRRRVLLHAGQSYLAPAVRR